MLCGCSVGFFFFFLHFLVLIVRGLIMFVFSTVVAEHCDSRGTHV